MKPVALLIHAPDVPAALAWYTSVFPNAKQIYHAAFDFTALDVDGFLLEIVPGDEKVSAGLAGTVVYWAVEDLALGIDRLQQLGAVLYRGPIAIENGLGMCQFKEPFGNLIGLRGAFTFKDSWK